MKIRMLLPMLRSRVWSLPEAALGKWIIKPMGFQKNQCMKLRMVFKVPRLIAFRLKMGRSCQVKQVEVLRLQKGKLRHLMWES